MIKLRCCTIWVILSLALFASKAIARDALTFGVVPQQSAQKLASGWGPVCTYLSQKTGLDIRFATAPDISEFELRLLAGAYDIAYMNPYHYTVFSVKPGYRAVAKEKNKLIQGIIVVRKDSLIEDISDLSGETVVFPSPAAFAASILPRSYFSRAGISITPKYVKSHDSVYRNVAKGYYVAGGGVVRTLTGVAPEIRDQLKILWKTESYTPHAVAIHPRIADDVGKRIMLAMLEMRDDQETESLLKAINIGGFTVAVDSDWDDVRALKIDLLTPLIFP